MKINVDKAIEILQEYVALDRSIREGDADSDYNRFCTEKVDAIESLIEYVFASKCAFKTSNAISKKVEDIKSTNDLKKILACLSNCTFIVDDEYISEEKRLKLIDYNYDILYKVCDILGIVLEDSIVDIDTLDIKELK